MKPLSAHKPLLRRYWFRTKERLGIGVTAFTIEDAKRLVEAGAQASRRSYEIVDVIEDVDVRDLDQDHAIPNMAPPNFRGVWYPRL